MAGFTQSYVTQSRQGILLTSDNQGTTQACKRRKKSSRKSFFLILHLRNEPQVFGPFHKFLLIAFFTIRF